MTDTAKAAPMREDVTPGDRFRHVKRGTEYEVVGVAQLQTTGPLFDDSVMVVYRGDDGQLWTREVHEFLDRRFERLAHTARPDAGDEDVERVARAIYEADDPWHKAWEWPNLNPEAQGGQSAADKYRDIARAALAAMREGVDRGMVQVPRVPSEAMFKAARKARTNPHDLLYSDFSEIYRAMIDAAALDPEQPR